MRDSSGPGNLGRGLTDPTQAPAPDVTMLTEQNGPPAEEPPPVSAPAERAPAAPARRALDPPVPAPPDPDAPELLVNRELSTLAFHRRVLEQARDPGTPLLERLRFLTISTAILDEFFEVRVATHKQRLAFGVTRPDEDGRTPRALLSEISAAAHELVGEQYRVLNEELAPALEAEGIRVVPRLKWEGPLREWAEQFFAGQVMPVLTPVGLDPAHPFPRILNKSLNFIVRVEGQDAFGRLGGTAVLQVPRSLPRLIPVPSEVAAVANEFVLLSAMIRAHVEQVFPGLEVVGCFQFRVTRNSDLWLDEEEVDDLLKALEGELPSRRYGDAVRLEVAMNCPDEEARLLLSKFQLGPEELYRCAGPVNLHRLQAIYDAVERPDLKYDQHLPRALTADGEPLDMFQLLRQRDVLLHHPYESFRPVLDLLRQAASDPDVLAIKLTLYRTGGDSPVIEALLEAARRGVEVTAVVELLARFDEEQNIDLATRLQDAGANVVYGIFGIKTHAKMLMIVRREGDQIRRYVHLGTGNYHAGTARLYTDLGLLTASKSIGQDVHRLFNELTGLGRATRLKRLIQAPFDLHRKLIEWIEDETRAARNGHRARIVMKMNSLAEPNLIRALYRASQAGVEIDLIVRGICGLRPGVEGVSERIRVRSIVGRFLEHSRVYWFHARGRGRTYLASADCMYRNFFRRVEIAFPVRDEELRRRIWDECLETYLRDDAQAWRMHADGTYERLEPSDPEAPFAAQEALMRRLG